MLGPYLEWLPRSCDNSYFSATEVGPDGTVYTGNFAGLTVYRTTTPTAPTSGDHDREAASAE